MSISHNYRLCVLVTSWLCNYASGSLTIAVLNCLTFTTVVCLHLGQNKGKLASTVSSINLIRVLFLQTGHKSHSSFFIIAMPFSFLLSVLYKYSQPCEN